MTQFQQYSKIKVYVNGQLQYEEADVKTARNSGLQPVNTVLKGLAGFSRGPSFMDIDVTSTIPAIGMEYDAGPDMDELNIVQITLELDGGATLTTNGAIMNDDTSHGVGQEAKYGFKAHCEFANWINLG